MIYFSPSIQTSLSMTGVLYVNTFLQIQIFKRGFKSFEWAGMDRTEFNNLLIKRLMLKMRNQSFIVY